VAYFDLQWPASELQIALASAPSARLFDCLGRPAFENRTVAGKDLPDELVSTAYQHARISIKSRYSHGLDCRVPLASLPSTHLARFGSRKEASAIVSF
jgi:hypothetical protein